MQLPWWEGEQCHCDDAAPLVRPPANQVRPPAVITLTSATSPEEGEKLKMTTANVRILEKADLPRSSRYRLVKCIATGGMGAVFIGVHRGAEGFERTVAIKRAHKHLVHDAAFRETILKEARHGSAVRHPNVVSIDDVEEVDGELLLIMEYIEGGSLSQLLGGGRRMPVGVALRIILDAALGLHAIHTAKDAGGQALGLVHRDISPQNILVGVDGVTRIGDFGIAKGVRDPGQTGPSMRRGKFGYMSPEYIKYRVSSASSDLFALGIVLWESLAGRRLFEGATGLESIKLAAAAVVPSLRALRPEISVELDTLVQRCLARSPVDRFRNPRELVERLQTIANAAIASRADVADYAISVRGRTSAPGTGPRAETLSSNFLVEESSSTKTVLTSELEIDPAPNGITQPIATQAFLLSRPKDIVSPVPESGTRTSGGTRFVGLQRRVPLKAVFAGAAALLLLTSSAAIAYAGRRHAPAESPAPAAAHAE
jgi:serine/threonine protein kinase